MTGWAARSRATSWRPVTDPDETQRLLGFGARLRQLREASKLTRKQLARHARVSVSHLRKLECGARRTTYPTLQRLAIALTPPQPRRIGQSVAEYHQQEEKRIANTVQDLLRALVDMGATAALQAVTRTRETTHLLGAPDRWRFRGMGGGRDGPRRK